MANTANEGVATTLRRNGKPSSCEPCRKSKLSCDHLRPICGRCQRRRAPERCVYHPAPMTNNQQLGPTPSTETLSSLDNHRLRRQHRRSVSSSRQDEIPSIVAEASTESATPVPGFLGPTSYSAVFTEGESNIGLRNRDENREINIRGWRLPKLRSWDSCDILEGVAVLELLVDLEVYEPALQRWYQVEGLYSTIPFARQCIALVPRILKTNSGHRKSFTTLAHEIFLRTSTPCPLDSTITMQEYPSFLMGDNLSWEVVGIILSVAGLGSISMDEVNVLEADPNIDWKDRAQKLVRAGETCIAFSEQFGHLKGDADNFSSYDVLGPIALTGLSFSLCPCLQSKLVDFIADADFGYTSRCWSPSHTAKFCFAHSSVWRCR